jgi:two-component SAPR family response regulator
LATAVTNLRLSLEPELDSPNRSSYVWQTAQGYQINPAIPLWSDLEHVATRLEQIRLEPNPQRAKTALEALLTHFRGDYLADLRETAVCSPRRQQHAQKLHLDALEAAGDCHRQLDQPEKAKKLYLSALMLDPDRETAYQKLLRLALPHSRKIEAIQSCQRLAASLRRELDFVLDEEFRTLVKEAQIPTADSDVEF